MGWYPPTRGMLPPVGRVAVGGARLGWVTTERQLVRDRPVARLHVIALRAGPFILWLLSLYLILVGTLGGKPETESITMTVVGAVIAVTGAAITRAESLKVGKEGVEATMTSLLALDPERFGVVISTDQRPALPPAESSPTGAEVVASAVAAGWTVAHTTGAAHLTLTKTNIKPTASSAFSPGDTITVQVPINELAAPVPRTLITTLLGAGLAIPPSSKSGDDTRQAAVG